jgi:hypothetical protein
VTIQKSIRGRHQRILESSLAHPSSKLQIRQKHHPNNSNGIPIKSIPVLKSAIKNQIRLVSERKSHPLDDAQALLAANLY